MKGIIRLVFVLGCLTGAVSISLAQTKGSTRVQNWLDGAGFYYSAYHDGHWYILARPYGTDPARVCEVSLADPNNISITRTIPLDLRFAPYGFAINGSGEFLVCDGSSVRTYDGSGQLLTSFGVSVASDYYKSPVAAGKDDRVYVVGGTGVAIYTREGRLDTTVTTGQGPASVAVAPDSSFWVVTCAGSSCHLEHYAAYPSCAKLADYDRWGTAIAGIEKSNGDNYLDWQEVIAPANCVIVTHGYGNDAGQSLYVLTDDGDSLLNNITSTSGNHVPPTIKNAHGLASHGDTLIYFDIDANTDFWLNFISGYAVCPQKKVEVVRPRTGDVWTIGTRRQVAWTSSGVATVEIGLSRDGGSTWAGIASSVGASLGAYEWEVTGPESDNCLIRVADASGSSVAVSGVFSILSAGSSIDSIVVTYPVGGQSLFGGSKSRVEWTARAGVRRVNVELRSNGALWQMLAPDVEARSGPIYFVVPDAARARCRVRVSSTDSDSVFGESGEFSVVRQFDVCDAGDDGDQDGIPDSWEVAGGIDLDIDGVVDLDLYAMGARPDHKDVFVEVDAMQGLAPSPQVTQSVREAFSSIPNDLVGNPDGNNGINLHVVVDESDIPRAPWLNLDRNMWPVGFDELKRQKFGSQEQRHSANWPIISAACRRVFHYCIFGLSYGTDGSSGRGEIFGNDFLVTLGGWHGGQGGTVEEQAGTFMHELGHNLGLRHGGGDDVNYKPNYISVMNYAWQVPNGWQRYGDWGLRYSRIALRNLNEAALDEVVGFGGPPFGAPALRVPFAVVPQSKSFAHAPLDTGSVDWNQNGKIDTQMIAADINALDSTIEPRGVGQNLVGYADWPSLRYRFCESPYYADGVHDSLVVAELTYKNVLALSDYSLCAVRDGRSVRGTTSVLFAQSGLVLRTSVESQARVIVELFDVVGRRWLVRVVERIEPGDQVVHIDASDIPDGLYMCRVLLGDTVKVTKVVIVR